jgi:hypothetical protein
MNDFGQQALHGCIPRVPDPRHGRRKGWGLLALNSGRLKFCDLLLKLGIFI